MSKQKIQTIKNMFLPTNTSKSEVWFCPDFGVDLIFGISPKLSFALIYWFFACKTCFYSITFFLSEKCCVPNDYENSGHFICFNCNFASKSSLVLLNYVLRQVLYPTNNVKNEERAFLRAVFDFYAQHWTQKISVIITPLKSSLWS